MESGNKTEARNRTSTKRRREKGVDGGVETGKRAHKGGWQRAMQNRSDCTVAGKSKLAASVSHTSSAYALVSFISLACFRLERNEHAEPCC